MKRRERGERVLTTAMLAGNWQLHEEEVTRKAVMHQHRSIVHSIISIVYIIRCQSLLIIHYQPLKL